MEIFNRCITAEVPWGQRLATVPMHDCGSEWIMPRGSSITVTGYCGDWFSCNLNVNILSLCLYSPRLTFVHPADILQLIETLSESVVICKLIYYLLQTSRSDKLPPVYQHIHTFLFLSVFCVMKCCVFQSDTAISPTQPPSLGAKIGVANVNKTRSSHRLSTCVKMPFCTSNILRRAERSSLQLSFPLCMVFRSWPRQPFAYIVK